MRKPISDATKKKLFALSGNQCCYPGCNERVYKLEDEALLGEICHIKAVNPTGARYDPELPEEQVNTYDNLIILCPNHHTIIDKNEGKYSAQILKSWKEEHESKFYDNANLFDELTEQSEGVIDGRRLEELEAIDATVGELQASVVRALPQKKYYPPTQNYIQRYVTTVRDANSFTFESKTLVHLVNEKNRIVVLGVAGSGKSIELAQIAHNYSDGDSEFHPVKVRLNTITNQPIEHILKLEYPELDQIPHERLLIMLDALDEVHSDYIDIVVNNIRLFSKKYEKSKIIVSCRNNFYITENDKRSAKLEEFDSYLIKPLDYPSIVQYLKENIDVSPEEFIIDLRRKKFYDLLYSPFYLVNLVAYYKSKQEIPESKKTVFDYLINQRIETDLEKYGNAGVNIEDHAFEIDKIIQELAVIAECLGRNYLEGKAEVQAIISDQRLLQVVKRTFLFNRSAQNDRWEFEHNNFQEFLAAKFLSSRSFQEIQTFISFEPDFKKIKPSWLNTLSFLFSLLDPADVIYSEVVSWVKRIEPDILIRFEKDKIPLQEREKIFRHIYEEYESKEIVIRNEKFESEDLAIFVSDSEDIIKYLLTKVVSTNNHLIVSEAAYILHYFEKIDSFKVQVRDALMAKLVGDELPDRTKYTCLYALANLKIGDDELTSKIVDNNDFEGSQYIRAGVYKYLQASNLAEKNIEIILRGIELLEKPVVSVNGEPKQTEVRLSDEKFNLEDLLGKIRSPEGLKLIIEWASGHDSYSNFDGIFFETVGKTLKKAAHLNKVHIPGILDVAINLLVSFSRRYYRELGADFRYFFETTGTQLEAFHKLYQNWRDSGQEDFDLTYAMVIVCNSECIEFLVDEIKEGRFVDPSIWRFRNVLAMDGRRDLHDLYHDELLKIDEDKYAYREIDHESLTRARRNRDIELLFAKDEFLKEVKTIFADETSANGRLSWDELYDWKRKKFNDEEMTNNIVVDTLRDMARDKKFVELSEIEELIADEQRWLWFKLHKLVKYDQNDDHFEYPDYAIDFIQTWVVESMKSSNFKSAITFARNGQYNYRYTELYISFFVQRLKIEVPESTLLNLLDVESYFVPTKGKTKRALGYEGDGSSTFDYVIDRIGKNEVTKRVIGNLASGESVPVVKSSYFKYCQDHKIKEAATYIFDEILVDGVESYYQRLLITQFTELSDDNEKLFDILDDLILESRLHAAEKLASKGYAPIVDYIEQQISSEADEEIRLRYILIVERADATTGFSLLKSWILRNKKLPERFTGFDIASSATIPDLIEIFEDSLDNNYGNDHWSSRNDYLVALIKLGSRSESNYQVVRDKLNQWIGKYENVKFLYYQLQNLEQQFYSKKSQTITFSEARGLVSNLKSSEINSGFNRFWESNKSIIELVVAIITVVGAILAVIALL